MTHYTAEEVEQRYVAQMGADLGVMFYQLFSECCTGGCRVDGATTGRARVAMQSHRSSRVGERPVAGTGRPHNPPPACQAAPGATFPSPGGVGVGWSSTPGKLALRPAVGAVAYL